MISFVIPAFNEAGSIPHVVGEIVRAMSAEGGLATPFEIIVVDDHSTDNTFGAVVALSDKRVRCLRLSRRSGSHTALRAGLAASSGQAVCCLSADGQDDPGVVPEMLAAWRSGQQVVWALRTNRDDEPLKARVLAKLFYMVLAHLKDGIANDTDLARADFYLLDRRVVDAILSCPERNTSLFGLIAWLGFKQGKVEYVRRPRRLGHSKWSARRKMQLALDWLVSFSGVPLKLVTVMGFGIALVGLLYALFIIVNTIAHGTPLLGWPTLVTLILILGGAQLCTLGVLGEYLWRSLDESKRRPLYFIERSSVDD